MKALFDKPIKLDNTQKRKPWKGSKDKDLDSFEITEFELITGAIKANGLTTEEYIKQALWWYSKRIYKPAKKTTNQRISDDAIEAATKLYIEAYGKARFPTIAKINGFNNFTVLRWAYINMRDQLTPKQIAIVESKLQRRD